MALARPCESLVCETTIKISALLVSLSRLSHGGGERVWSTAIYKSMPKAMVIKLMVSQTRPRPLFTFWPPFLLLNKRSKEHVIDAAKV